MIYVPAQRRIWTVISIFVLCCFGYWSTWGTPSPFQDATIVDFSFSTEIHDTLSSPQPEAIRPFVSLASTANRTHELVTTLHSLTHQSLQPREIRVFLPQETEAGFERFLQTRGDGRRLRAIMDNHNVPIQVRFVKDIGPATKFVYAIRELLDVRDLDSPLVIVDDDHFYSPDLIASLIFHMHLPSLRDSAIGLRGWRIREDLQWGVGSDEYSDHVIEGWTLDDPYRASVLTANDGYLIFPRWFAGRESGIPDGSQQSAAGLLDLAAMSSSPAHLVDDIWMAGHLCVGRVPKFIVPLNIGFTGMSRRPKFYLKTAVPSVDIARHPALEAHMAAEGRTRGEANNEALHLFEDAWRQEGLYYVLKEHRAKHVQGHTHPLTRVPFSLANTIGPVSFVRRWILQRAYYARSLVMFGSA